MRSIRVNKTMKSIIAACVAVCAAGALASAQPGGSKVTVVADNLNNPRGIAVAPDGSVYVAESGKAGPTCSGEGRAEICVAPSGSITRVKDGKARRVVRGLLSGGGRDGTFTGGPQGVSVTGEGEIYIAMTTAPDCAPTGGFPAFARKQAGRLLKANQAGKFGAVANIGAIECRTNPDKQDRNANPYAVLALGAGHEVAVDAGANTLVDVQGRKAKTLSILPRRNGRQAVPTAIALGPDGAYYVGQFGGTGKKGGASVFRVVPGAKPTIYRTGFTNITGVAFGPDGSLYVTQFTNSAGESGSPVGSVVKVAPDGTRTVLGQGKLFFASGTAVDAAGNVYVSNWSVLPGAKQRGGPFKGKNGQLVRIAP